jgi:hypothetical protein
VRRFSGALGLRGHERITGGHNSRADLRWTIPLPRGIAARAKSAVEAVPGAYKDLLVPKHPTRMETFEATFADVSGGRVGYVAGASFVSLRRLLVVDAVGVSIEAVRRNAQRALMDVGLESLTAAPEHAEMYRHLRAATLLRRDPALYAKLYDEAEEWPPSLTELAVLERELMVAPSEAAAVRVAPDRATSFALIRDRAFDRLAPPLYVASDQLDEVATLCAAGFLSARWQLIGHALRPTTLAGVEDLKSAAGAYTALKMLMPNRVGTFIQEPQEYLVMVSGSAFDRVERHVVDRDRYGTIAGIETGLSEEQLKSALASEILTLEHEALFPDGLPPTLISGVICRTERGESQLKHMLDGYRLRTRTAVSDRYVSI